LGIIPVTANNFDVIQYNIDQMFMVAVSTRVVTNLDIQLRDAENRPLDLNGVNYEVSIKVSLKKHAKQPPLERLIRIERALLDIQSQRALVERQKLETKEIIEERLLREEILKKVFT